VLALALLSLGGRAQADINARRIAPLLRAFPMSRPLAEDTGALSLLVKVPDGVYPEDRSLLPLAPGMGAIWLAPDALDAYLGTYPDVIASLAPPRRAFIDYATARWTRLRGVRNDTGLDGTGVVIGIIDTGLDVTHLDFRDAMGKTRVAWLMQREAPRGLQPELESRYGCNNPDSPCAIYSAADIDKLIVQEPDAAPRDGDGHGTHVTSLAAGNGFGSPAPHVYAGAAPAATIIVASPSTGGGFRDADIVRAARFIFDRADEAMGMPAVVNVSLGSDFGPHDGTSALESGLASMVGDDQPGHVLVVAAGNSGELFDFNDGNLYGIHTEAHVSEHGVTRVPIAQPGAKGTIDGSGFVWVNVRPGNEVSVGLEGPDGSTWLDLTGPGEELGYNGDGVSAGVVNDLVSDKTSLTEETDGAVVFWDGSWQVGEFAVLLRGVGDAQLWVTGTGQAGPGANTVGLAFLSGLKTGTVAVPASHEELIAVGCTLNRTDWAPIDGDILALQRFGSMEPPIEDSICYFSGAGPTPTGGMKPDIVAPGAFVAGAMSRDADPRNDPLSIFVQTGCSTVTCGLVDNTHAITAGTSMSAPQVAGAAALLLQREPSLRQRDVRDILQAGARRPIGAVPYDFQQGPGALDMRGAIDVLEGNSTGTVGDPGASFYVLSSPYLRPTPRWPVQAVIQLRHTGGAVVMGDAAQDISIALDGGVIVEPLHLVRAGTYAFSLGAPRGSGGTFATLDVSYRGQSLGKRTLPVSVDVWATGQDVAAVGGFECSVGRASDGSALWLSLLGLSLFAYRRRRSFFTATRA
jgi:MYXO-CTERM domain-containing protein